MDDRFDPFAQSRGDDDLFADDFEPVVQETVIVPEPETTRPVSAHNGLPPRAGHADSASGPAGNGGASDRGRREGGRGEGRGRGGQEGRGGRGGRGGQERRGGGGGQRGRGAGPAGLASSQYATEAAASPAPEASKTSESQTQAQNSTSPSTDPSAPARTAPSPPPTTQTQAPPPENDKPARAPAVRGDRSATGGPAHKKLTEEELAEKLEKMKILNAQKAERFRLSEADSAAFAMRERESAQKRLEEQRATRHQDMERAKNRQRKLQAQGGREWDSEKVDSDIVDGRGRGRSSEYVRGGHGGIIRGGLAGSRYATADQEGPDTGRPSRGRGGYGGHEGRGRGNRGGRGGGRGGAVPSTIPTPEDFPSLPTPAKSPTPSAAAATEVKPSTTEKETEVKSPTAEKGPGDWAEEMATPVDEKKITV